MSICPTTNINVSIPSHICGLTKFIKVISRGKKAIEKNFSSTKNYSHDDPVLIKHLESGGNYGVLGSSSFVIIDLDNENLIAHAEPLLPPTFTVLSGSGRGPHRYYRITGNNAKNATLVNPQHPDENWGNIQSTGKYAIGPGSIHPSGGTYSVANDIPVAEITFEELKRIFSQFIRVKKEVNPDDVRRRYGLYSDIFNTVTLADVGCYPVNPIDRGNGEIQGAHPIHGSTSGMNFAINTNKNTFHCYRCESGGGPLEWLAVSEGIIDCAEAGPGCLRGEKFKRVLEIAKERGIKVSLPKKLPPPRAPILAEDRSPQQIPDDQLPQRPTIQPQSDDFVEYEDPEEYFSQPDPEPEQEHEHAVSCPVPESRVMTLPALPEQMPDADVVLFDAPPRLGKTHRLVTWAARDCRTANLITTSHSIVEQHLRIFRDNKNEWSTAVHLEGKDRCCLKKEQEACKLCEYYPFDGENFLDIRQYVKDLLNSKKLLTKENVNKNTGMMYCPYYILRHAEPFADYCFTVVANIDKVSKREYTFIDEDPAIDHFFANSAELLEASFHQSSATVSSKLEERWKGIEKYKEYLENHRHENKKVLMRIIQILEQFRAILNVENMTRETKESLIDQLNTIDTTLPEVNDDPYKLIDHVKRFEIPETFSPYVEALLFQYTNKKFMWTGSSPSTLHLIAVADKIIRKVPEGKLVIIGSTRAYLFLKDLHETQNKEYKVIRVDDFPYSNWFAFLVVREETNKSGKKLIEQVLKKSARTNNDHRYPMLVLTGSEKHQRRLKSILGGIAHSSSDENQIGQMWNKRGGFINIFYQNSVISRGIDVDFYNMMVLYTSDFATPYWSARLEYAHEMRDVVDADYARLIIDNITVDETTNSVLRISPVRTTQDSLPRVVLLSDNDLWKIKETVLSGSLRMGIDADFFETSKWEQILETRKLGLFDIWQDPEQVKHKLHELREPNMNAFERMITGSTELAPREWRRNHNPAHLTYIEGEIRNHLQDKQQRGWRVSEISLVNFIVQRKPKRELNLAREFVPENVLRIVQDMVRSGEVIREYENNRSMLSLRERYVPPEVGNSDQFDV